MDFFFPLLAMSMDGKIIVPYYKVNIFTWVVVWNFCKDQEIYIPQTSKILKVRTGNILVKYRIWPPNSSLRFSRDMASYGPVLTTDARRKRLPFINITRDIISELLTVRSNDDNVVSDPDASGPDVDQHYFPWTCWLSARSWSSSASHSPTSLYGPNLMIIYYSLFFCLSFSFIQMILIFSS